MTGGQISGKVILQQNHASGCVHPVCRSTKGYQDADKQAQSGPFGVAVNHSEPEKGILTQKVADVG